MNGKLAEILKPYFDYLSVVKEMALSSEGIFIETPTGEVTINGITLSRNEFDRIVRVICMDEPEIFKPEMFVVAKEV